MFYNEIMALPAFLPASPLEFRRSMIAPAFVPRDNLFFAAHEFTNLLTSLFTCFPVYLSTCLPLYQATVHHSKYIRTSSLIFQIYP